MDRVPIFSIGCYRFKSYHSCSWVCSLTGKASTLQVERCGFDSHQYPLWCLKSKRSRHLFVEQVIREFKSPQTPLEDAAKWLATGLENQGRVTPRGSIPPSSLTH